MSKAIFFIVRIVVDLLLGILLYLGYTITVNVGMKIVNIPIFPVEVLLGFIGLGLVLLIFGWIRKSLLIIIKLCHIYSISQNNSTGILKSFIGISKRLKYTLSIPILNKLIRDIVEKVIDKLSEDNLYSKLPKSLEKIVEVIGGSFILNIGMNLYSKQLDYLNECIVCYCYKYKNKKMVQSIKEAISIFMKNTVTILEKTASIVVISFLIRIAEWLIFIYVGIKFIPLSFYNVIKWYVVSKYLTFVVSDAIIEPLFLEFLIKEFMNVSSLEELSNEDNEQKEFNLDFISSLLEKINGLTK